MTLLNDQKLTPFVHWAQNQDVINIKLEIRNVTDPNFQLSANRFEFEAVGDGSQGTNLYGVTVDFFQPVVPESLEKKILESRIELSVKKKAKEWWPRLLSGKSKPTWLKVDFDKWEDPDAQTSEDEFSEAAMEKRMAEETVRKLMQDYDRADPGPAFDLNLRTPYLITYNVAMFLGYLLMIVEMVHGYSSMGTEYFPKTWAAVSPKLKCCQIAQCFEVFHSLLKMTRTSWKASLLQVTARLFILFVILSSEPRLQDKPFVFYLFMVWSSIEIFRYPYYALAVKGRSWNLLTWLRYNMWIPLYPLGSFIEVIMIRSFPYFDETGRFSVTLPNPWNISFDFGLFLKIFVLFIFCPGVIFLLKYMRKQRVAKLGKMRAEARKKLK